MQDFSLGGNLPDTHGVRLWVELSNSLQRFINVPDFI